MTENYYRILQIDVTATGEEIKKAYRKLALEHHPDLNRENASEEKIKKINAAYDVLSDPEKKKLYDLYGHVPRSGAGAANNFSGRQSYGRGFPRGRGRGCGGGCRGKGFGAWSSVFRNHAHTIAMEGADYICKISFSAEELEQGARRFFLIRDNAGAQQISVAVPPGSRRGTRIIAGEARGEATGKIIIEIQ